MRRRNVTITLDERTARWARVEAAKRDTSVSRLVGDLLRERMEAEEGYSAAARRYLGRRARPLKRAGASYPDRDALHERARAR